MPLQEPPAHLDALLEVGARVHVLEDAEVVVEVVDEAALLVAEEDGVRRDRPLVAPQRVARDAVFVDDAPELVQVAVRVKERQVRLYICM